MTYIPCTINIIIIIIIIIITIIKA